MNHKNEIIESLDFFNNTKEEHFIENCIIMKLVMTGCDLNEKVIIIDSIIHGFHAIGARFDKGLLLQGCIFNNKLSLEASGQNYGAAKIEIENNIFNCYVDFFDAHFLGSILFKNNILNAGSNLLGNKGLPWETMSKEDIIVSNNFGNLQVREKDESV